MTRELVVIGGGLSGCEAAWQAAQRGISVSLYEMRPESPTGAHSTGNLAELVCSNSLGSTLPDRASGILISELKKLNSLLLDCANRATVPAGSALAVDRNLFSELVTERIDNHPNIILVRKKMDVIPDTPTIIASGPLTSKGLSEKIAALAGIDHLFFYDAISPIISRESLDMSIAFQASRYGEGFLSEGDYINCPFTMEQYDLFVENLIAAERIEIREFEQEIQSGVKAGFGHFFEGCLPVEIIAMRGKQSLAFGPMRPVGLSDPKTGHRPHAVVQLRQDNQAGDLYNLVGFQTNLKFHEQKRVFRMIPGMEKAEFVRYGQMHRNTFIASPNLLLPTLQFKGRPNLFFAGQLTGVEGYLGNIATGLLAGINAVKIINNTDPLILPGSTMLGALCKYICSASLDDFQPMKANLGILDPLDGAYKSKPERAKAYAERSKAAMDEIANKIMDGPS